MDANIAVTQFTAAGVAVWALQQLKTAKWFPALSQDSHRWIKRLASVATAIGIHTGISAVWNAGTPPVGYQYQLIINIPSATVIAITVWHWIGQYVMQEGWYQVAFNRVTLTSAADAGPAIPARITAEGQIVVPKIPASIAEASK